MANRVKLDRRGVGELLRSAQMHRTVQAAAEAVANNVKEQNITVGDKDGGRHEYPLPVEVSMTTTDRAHAVVALAHPSGLAVQAKHGALTKAAGQAGLDVKGK